MSGLFGAPDQRSSSSQQPLFARRSQAQNLASPPDAPGVRTVTQRPRHSGLFEAVHRLDTEIDEASRRELGAWISDQYAKEYGDIPLGFLSRCYLGPPYVDHRLSLLQSIVEHFTPGSVVPAPFDRARALARNSDYEFIEVYASGTLVPVRADGSVDASIGG